MIHKHAWTKEVDTALDKASERILKKIGIKISGDAIDLAPIDEGRLKGSITYATVREQSAIRGKARADDKIRKPSSKNVVHIGTGVGYAQHVEYGTRPHPINRAVPMRDKNTGELMWRYIGTHPGTKPQSYLRKALDQNRKMIPHNFSAEISKAFQGK